MHLYDAYWPDLYEARDPNLKPADSNKVAPAGFSWLLIRPVTKKFQYNCHLDEQKAMCLGKPGKALVNNAVSFYC